MALRVRHERMTVSRATGARLALAIPADWMQRGLFAFVCAVTLSFALLTPPFQAPDENQHYMKALLLSEGHVLAGERHGLIGAELPRAAVDLHGADFPTDVGAVPRRFDPAALAEAWHADAGRTGRVFVEFPNVANYAPTLYAPGAAGLKLGDGLGLPRLGSFYAGRLVNALTGLALLAAALALLPFGRNALLATALLPTFCYQGGSLSPDAVINGLGFVGVALALRIAFMGARPNGGVSGALFVVAPLLALAKGVYLPLLAAGLRKPESRRDTRVWLLVAAIAVGATAFIAWMKLSGGTPALYHIMSRKTGETVMTAPLSAQLGVILADPLGYGQLLSASVVERAPVYALQIVGRFGWNAILLPLAAYPLGALMLAAAVPSGSGLRIGAGQRLWWLAVAGGCGLLIETAMYLTGTPLAADYIQGTQGRYFLPLLPLVLLAAMPARPIRGARAIFAGSALLLSLIALGSAFDSFWIRGFVTSDGMPPHERLVDALLLPSPRWID